MNNTAGKHISQGHTRTSTDSRWEFRLRGFGGNLEEQKSDYSKQEFLAEYFLMSIKYSQLSCSIQDLCDAVMCLPFSTLLLYGCSVL